MAYTYLITGATSDVGRTLIERLLHNAPADTLVLAQGCGDLAKMAELCRRYPGQLRTYDVDLSDRARCWQRTPRPRPTLSTCLLCR